MLTDDQASYDAEEIRRLCIEQDLTRNISGSFSISRSKEGIYSTQKGSFEITTDNVIIGVCVWENAVVEIHTLNLVGDTKDIETVRRVSAEEAVNKIREHVEKYA